MKNPDSKVNQKAQPGSLRRLFGDHGLWSQKAGSRRNGVLSVPLIKRVLE